MSFFICGTDTGIGKTITSGLLMREFSSRTQVSYWKPVQSGAADDDSLVVHQMSGVSSGRILPKLWHLQEPLSPHLAAELDGIQIDLPRLCNTYHEHARHGSLIVEGAGGLLVPLGRQPQYTWIDFLECSRLPVLLIARSGLGTINHSLLTLHYLQNRSIPVSGIIFCGPENKDNRLTICDFSGVPCLGAFDYKRGKADFWQEFDLVQIRSLLKQTTY